jgi:hypothetical protein
VDIEVSTWSSRPFPGTGLKRRFVLKELKETMPLDKEDVEVSSKSSRLFPEEKWASRLVFPTDLPLSLPGKGGHRGRSSYIP